MVADTTMTTSSDNTAFIQSTYLMLIWSHDHHQYHPFFSVALRPNADHGLLSLEVSRSHTTTHHSRYDSSGRVISSSQRPLPDNTHHSQLTNIHAPVGFEPTMSAGELPQTYALDRTATGTGCRSNIFVLYSVLLLVSTIYIIHLQGVFRSQMS